jgi:hypothetical protein
MSINEYVDAAVALKREMDLEISCTLEGVEELRNHLEQLETLLQNRLYESASALGYHEVSTGFVYVQRCLGGIEELHLDEQLLVQELARERQCYEEEARDALEAEIARRGDATGPTGSV